MTKALLKKQLLEIFSWLYVDRKSGKKRSRGKTALCSSLYGVLFLYLAALFFFMAYGICKPLSMVGYGWLYFLVVGLIGIVFGVAGSVFNTYASLYIAKDNDLLLSLPIPAPKILLVRLSGVYIMGLAYELVVMLPAVIVWLIWGSYTFLGAIFSILLPFVISFFVMTLSCALGWVVALIAARVKNKSLVTVLIALTVLALYFVAYYKIYDMIGSIVVNADAIAGFSRSVLYPFYQMGLAAEGNALSMLIFTAMVSALFLLTVFLLSKSFFRIATKAKSAYKVHKKESLKLGNSSLALFKKEAKRFLSSPTYILNCSLGSLFMLGAAVFLLVKQTEIYSMLTLLLADKTELVPLIGLLAVVFIGTMNDITAPSVSLEGKNVWIVQSLPVSPYKALLAKLYLHLALTFPPYIILLTVTMAVLKVSLGYAALSFVVGIAFALFMALFGLFMNLLAPNLKWTNEMVPIKQSLSVTVTIFGGWLIATAFAALYFAVRSFITPLIYLIILAVVFAAASFWLLMWLKKRGAHIFSTL